ncbi:hypothetical protein LguiA_011971 [Lonicera macranthoides]
MDIYCSCGMRAILRTSRTPQNPRRMLFTCPNNVNGVCAFFIWGDVVISNLQE